MSKEVFNKVAKEVYIMPGYFTVQDFLVKESNFDIKPLVENIEKFSNNIYDLPEDNIKELLSGLTKVYDMQAASTGRLGLLRGTIHKYFEEYITTFKMKENIFFKPPTDDIRDIFSEDDVKEIFDISKVYYNGDIKSIIKKNLPNLVSQYLAKEISGVYIFTRAGVQLLLDDASKTSKAPTVTPVVKVEAPKDKPIKLDKKVEDGDKSLDDYFVKSSNMEKDLKDYVVSGIDPFIGGRKDASVPIHKADDYRRVLLNLIWYFQLYMGLPYFFNENAHGSRVCATQTKDLIIFHAEGLTRLLKTYYTYFYRRAVVFSLKDFVNGVRDMGYLPDKHALVHNNEKVTDVLVFDKNVIATYILKNNLLELVPSYERCVDWWKADKECETFNAVGAFDDFIDLSRKYNISKEDRKYSAIDNTKVSIKVGYDCSVVADKPTAVGTTTTVPVVAKPVEEKEKPKVVVAKVTKPKPSNEFEKMVYNSNKRIFLSDIVNWIVENSDTEKEENNLIKQAFDAMHKYTHKPLYKYVSELTYAIRNFDGIKNPILFNF